MESTNPIQTVHLFPVLDAKLLELLRSLSPAEWYNPTIAKKWVVKDIVAHLLDGNIRTLAFSRDKHTLKPPGPISDYRGLVDYLNELNAIWVNAFKRVSPEVMLEMLARTGEQYCDYLVTLHPDDEAIFAVAWAGENSSRNWFHIAREYTEKFIHQQQIRDAVGKPGLMTRQLFYPFIDTLLCGLPHTYRNVQAEKDTVVQVTITTEIGGDWFLKRETTGWKLYKQFTGTAQAIVSIDPDTAWKLFSKGLSPEDAKPAVTVSGDRRIAAPALEMISVMA